MSEITPTIVKGLLLYKAIVNALRDCYKIFEHPGMGRHADVGIKLLAKSTDKIIENSEKLDFMNDLKMKRFEIDDRLERKAKREIREMFLADMSLMPCNDYREVNRVIHNVLGDIESKEK